MTVVAKKLFQYFLRALVWIAHKLYGIEGINALLILMPAKLIAPTLRKHGASIGANVEIHSPLIIHNAKDGYRNLVIGDNCYFGREVFFDLADRITIDDNVTISMRVSILTHLDVGKSPLAERHLVAKRSPVHLKRGSYVGAGAMILHGVTVGEEAAVGAMSLVKRDVPSRTLVGGVPITVIRKFD